MANKPQTRKVLHTKDIKKMVSELSGYYQYEVNDIFDHLIAVIVRELLSGHIIKLKGLGHFYLNVTPPLTWYSGALKREVSRGSIARVRFNMDGDMKRSIAVDGELMSKIGKEEYGPKRQETT